MILPSSSASSTPRRTCSKAELTPACQRLVELMSSIRFGTIEQLRIAGGEPVFDQPPYVRREIKFGSEPGNDKKPTSDEFALKSQVRELLELFTEMGNGVIETLEFRHGLPFRVIIAETVARLENS